MELIDQLIPPSARYDLERTVPVPYQSRYISLFCISRENEEEVPPFSFLSRHIFRISTCFDLKEEEGKQAVLTKLG
jgi:hypothetical protein